MSRIIILDIETTGLNYSQGDRVIEIGCVEIFNRELAENRFHQYINPEYEVHQEAYKVHGIDNTFLETQPKISEVIHLFLKFVDADEIIAHNSNFDIGFLDHEIQLYNSAFGVNIPFLSSNNKITDSLKIARQKYPGQKNDLNSVAKRLGVDISHRELHGALEDALILAQVYLKMTGGQMQLGLTQTHSSSKTQQLNSKISNKPLVVQYANTTELDLHQKYFD